MIFELNEEQLAVQKVVREFAKKEVAPQAQENDELARFPMDVAKKMGKMGLLGVVIPQEYGGSGASHITYCIAIEELCKVCGSTGGIIAAMNSLVCAPLYKYGTEEQKKKFLYPIANGEKFGAFGLTESGAGSDAMNQQTTAELVGDEWVINGSKIFISGGNIADTHIVFASVLRKGRRRKGYIGAFIVEADNPGFSVGRVEHKMGIRASGTAELIFDNCRIPKDNLLGKLGRGFAIAMDTLDGGRIGIAAQAVGIAQGAYEEALSYAKVREQFGHPIARFQAIQWMLADMVTRIDCARLLTYRAAYLKDTGQPYATEAAQAKLYASETAVWVADKALQIHGGYGYMKEYPVERMYRDAKITAIYEGTSEIQRLVIATNILK